jgi:hypothetical protein
VAEYLRALATNYLDLAELALRLRRPDSADRGRHLKLVGKD